MTDNVETHGLELYEGEQFDAPNKQSLGLDPPWVEGEGGGPGDTLPVAATTDEEELPGRHAPLDDLAAERGHQWSRDDLTVAEKKQELGG